MSKNGHWKSIPCFCLLKTVIIRLNAAGLLLALKAGASKVQIHHVQVQGINTLLLQHALILQFPFRW